MERGYTLTDFQDFTQALEHHEAALAEAVKAYGRDHPAVAEEASRLGHILEALGELERARANFEQARLIAERCAGERKQAAAIWERSKEAYTRNHSAGHPQVGLCLANLARLQAAGGNLEGARQNYEKALAILQARLGPEHPLTREAREGYEGLGRTSG